MEQQVTILFALNNGDLDDVEIPKVGSFESAFHSFMNSNHPDILAKISEKGAVDDEIEGQLKTAIEEFKSSVPF